MISIKDNKGSLALYQYDTGQDLLITPKEGYSVDKVEFSTASTEKATNGVIRIENGEILVRIPDELLKSTEKICVYAVMVNGDARKTVDREWITIIERAEPEVSVPVPPDDSGNEETPDPVDVAEVLLRTEIYVADYSISDDIQMTAGVVDIWRRCLVS